MPSEHRRLPDPEVGGREAVGSRSASHEVSELHGAIGNEQEQVESEEVPESANGLNRRKKALQNEDILDGPAVGAGVPGEEHHPDPTA